MQDISEKQRVLALVGYVLWLCALQFFVIEPTVLPNEKTLWLYSGIASLLFGSHLLNPHFTPPAVAAVNGFFALSGAVAATVAIPPTSADAYLLWGLAVVSGLILISSLLVLVKRAPIGLDNPAWITNLDRAVRSLGGPKVIFTWVMLVFVWVFHRTQPVQVFAILASWGVIVALSPIESLLAYISRLRRMSSDNSLPRIVGVIAAHQSPGIVLIRQSDDTAVERGTALLIADSHGPSLLGVALNYVGRDEGNLLRALTLPMPRSLEPVVARSTLTPGVATSVSLSPADIDSISQDQPSHVLVQMSRFWGIVGVYALDVPRSGGSIASRDRPDGLGWRDTRRSRRGRRVSLVGAVGIEPTTCRSRAGSSTTELRQKYVKLGCGARRPRNDGGVVP
jgi:uncharacterized protein